MVYSVSKRQHIVQKWLLGKFTSTPQNTYEKQRIWQFDKETQQSVEISLKDAGIQKDFLTPRSRWKYNYSRKGMLAELRKNN